MSYDLVVREDRRPHTRTESAANLAGRLLGNIAAVTRGVWKAVQTAQGLPDHIEVPRDQIKRE